MIISCLYPQKIYIDDEKTKEQVEKTFGVKVNLGEWYECNNLIKNEKNNVFCNDNKKITYIVKPMDTYQTVSKKLQMSIDDLKSIAKTKNLFIGQRIDIQKGWKKTYFALYLLLNFVFNRQNLLSNTLKNNFMFVNIQKWEKYDRS